MSVRRFATVVAATLSAATTAEAQTAPAASGLAFWVRVPGTSVQEITAASAGAPRFAVGLRRGRFQVGLGFGQATARSEVRDSFEVTPPGGPTVSREVEDEATASLFQIGPTVMVDVWRSDDGRTRANVAAGFGYGRVSLEARDEFVDFLSGTVVSDTTRSSGGLLGFHLGFGGDHFLHRHFAIGAEAGYQAAASLDVEEEVDPGLPAPTRTSLKANGTYVALRMTLVF